MALANENREIQVIDQGSAHVRTYCLNLCAVQLSSLSFMANRTKAEKWRPEETDKFFMALQVFGTDFSMIEKLFADRSREQIKVGNATVIVV